MSVSIVVYTHGIGEAINRVNRIAGWRPEEGARLIAPILESQTRRRIEEEKTDPSGKAWPQNRAGTSILLRSGRNLRDSVAHRAAGGDAIVEAHWKFAHVHQTGMTIRPKNASRLVFHVGANAQPIFARRVTIPRRQFIGLSKANEDEIVDELNEMLSDLGGGQ